MSNDISTLNRVNSWHNSQGGIMRVLGYNTSTYSLTLLYSYMFICSIYPLSLISQSNYSVPFPSSRFTSQWIHKRVRMKDKWICPSMEILPSCYLLFFLSLSLLPFIHHSNHCFQQACLSLLFSLYQFILPSLVQTPFTTLNSAPPPPSLSISTE